MDNILVVQTLLVMLVIGVITFLTRALPFILFGRGNRPPSYVTYLGMILPPAVMTMLIIYCLKAIQFTVFPFGLPEIIGVVSVVLLHVWKRNNLISIFGGTALYMLLVQVVFV